MELFKNIICKYFRCHRCGYRINNWSDGEFYRAFHHTCSNCGVKLITTAWG